MKIATPLLFILIVFAFLLAGCTKSTSPETGAIAATLHDYTGLDGCSWVIKLENGEVLEPVNLADFTIELEEGKKVWLKYAEQNDLASICMVGLIVKIDRIWER
jgi:hypothetical protein